jgi:hypothetical protein
MLPVDMDSLKLFASRLDVQELSVEERKEYSCEKLMNGYEAKFCDDNLYFLSAADWKLHGGWTYACSRHLPVVSFGFLEAIEEKKLNQDFDKWNDAQSDEKEFVCPICNADYDGVIDLGNHMIEIHKTHDIQMKVSY